MLGCFTPRDVIRGVDPSLLGHRRMVVIDIDEFKTSYNYKKPSLDTDAEAIEAENVIADQHPLKGSVSKC